MDELIRRRFAARDKVFTEALVKVQRDMSARGMLHSGNTIEEGHRALVSEFIASRTAIVEALSESLQLGGSKDLEKCAQDKAFKLLRERRVRLEGLYKERMKVVLSSLKNEAMHAPYTTLAEVEPLQEQELRIGVNKVLEDFRLSKGITLYERTKNELLNRPLVVITVITISAVTATMAFLQILGLIG